MVRSLKSQPTRKLDSSALGTAVSSASASDAGSRAWSNQSGLDQTASDRPEKTPWEMRLNLGQLIVLWSVVGGTMIMVFLFGLYAGREQGVRTALDGQTAEAVRLPVANPVAVQESAVEAESQSVPVQVASSLTTGASGSTAASGSASGSIAQPAAEAPPAGAPRGERGATIAAQIPQGGAVGSGTGSTADAGGTAAVSDVDSPSTADADAAISGLLGASSNSDASDGDGLTLADKERSKKQEREKLKEKDKDKAKDRKTQAPETASDTARSETIRTVKTTQVAPGWYLQIAAARSNTEAAAVASKLRAAGLKPTIESAQVNSSTYYRVVLGPYPSKDAASAARKAAVASRAAKGEPFLKQIK